MSTTILETFDTQMLDYQNDADFSMHLSSSDQWFHDEATMEDDGRTLHLENPDTTIEVDMEPYDENHNAEYEMDDGSENFDLDSTEIVDVDVYDASRAHSPYGLHDHETPVLPASDPTDSLPIQAELLESSPPHIAPPARTEEAFGAEASASSPYVQYRSASPPNLQPSTVSPDVNEVPHAHAGEEQSFPQHAAADSEGGHRIMADHSIYVEAEEPFSGAHADANEKHLNIRANGDSGASEDATESHNIHASAEVTGELSEDESYEHGMEGQAEFDPSTASTGDPHEISEGVYIDPPPAVLISLSADSPSISLFNAPSKSRSNSPSNEESNVPDLVVLLGHLPTLYYEPLSSLFEAFREDEYLSRIPDLLNGELLLDAHDLELIMSEDYTFAHELSLHDLNVLHDGLNKPGPLRLRLRTVTPRFMDRYRTLHEQIAQFQITDSKDASVEHTAEKLYEREVAGGDPQLHLESEQQIEQQGHEQQAEKPEDERHPENGKPEVGEHAPKRTVIEDGHFVADNLQDDTQGDHEELEYVHEESILPLAGTDHTHEVSLTAPEAESGETEEYDEQEEHHDEQRDQPDEDGTAHSVTFEYEDPPSETDDASDIPPAVADKYRTEAAEENVATPQLSKIVSNLPAADALSTRNENLQHDDAQRLDFADLHDTSEQSGSVPTNLDDLPDAELDLTTNAAGESGQASSSADATLVVPPAHEVVELGDASFELNPWDDTLDGEGDPDTNWDEEPEHETASNMSSVTLSSKTSAKRSLSEVDFEEFEDEGLPPSSPDSKRPRVE